MDDKWEMLIPDDKWVLIAEEFLDEDDCYFLGLTCKHLYSIMQFMVRRKFVKNPFYYFSRSQSRIRQGIKHKFIPSSLEHNEFVGSVIKHGNWSTIKYLIGHQIYVTKYSFLTLAELGKLQIIRNICKYYGYKPPHEIILGFAYSGCLDGILWYMHKFGIRRRGFYHDMDLRDKIIAEAIRGNKPYVLIFLDVTKDISENMRGFMDFDNSMRDFFRDAKYNYEVKEEDLLLSGFGPFRTNIVVKHKNKIIRKFSIELGIRDWGLLSK